MLHNIFSSRKSVLWCKVGPKEIRKMLQNKSYFIFYVVGPLPLSMSLKGWDTLNVGQLPVTLWSGTINSTYFGQPALDSWSCAFFLLGASTCAPDCAVVTMQSFGTCFSKYQMTAQ